MRLMRAFHYLLFNILSCASPCFWLVSFSIHKFREGEHLLEEICACPLTNFGTETPIRLRLLGHNLPQEHSDWEHSIYWVNEICSQGRTSGFLFIYMNKVMIYMPGFSKSRLSSCIILFYLVFPFDLTGFMILLQKILNNQALGRVV